MKITEGISLTIWEHYSVFSVRVPNVSLQEKNKLKKEKEK